GKHEHSYLRVDRDHYPTLPWAVAASAEDVQEPATESGQWRRRSSPPAPRGSTVLPSLNAGTRGLGRMSRGGNSPSCCRRTSTPPRRAPRFRRRSDGIREAPKKNHAWCVWSRPHALRIRRPVILYAPQRGGGDE